MNQPKKLQAIIKDLRALETKMKEGDHIGFGMICLVLSVFPMFALIDGNMLVFIVSSICLGLGIPSYYLISESCARSSWYWEEVRSEVEGKDLREMWDTCERGDWLLWFAAHMIGKDGWPTHQQLVLASCQCARLAIKHVKSGETHLLKVIETTEAWAHGEVTPEQVIDAVNAAEHVSHGDDNASYCAAEALKSAAWAVYAREDGACFRLAQAASGAASEVASAASYEIFKAQLQICDFTPAAREVRDHAKKTTLHECADIVRRMLNVPNELEDELPIYDWVKRWHRNTSGQRTGRMDYIPIAISRNSPDLKLKAKEMDNTNLNPSLALRIVSVVIALAAAGALIGALGKNPAHYYTMLRWLTCSAAVMLVWRGDIQGSFKWAYVLVPVAILFNPIIPIHHHGKRVDILRTWHAVDIMAAVVMVLAVILMEIQVLRTKNR